MSNYSWVVCVCVCVFVCMCVWLANVRLASVSSAAFFPLPLALAFGVPLAPLALALAFGALRTGEGEGLTSLDCRAKSCRFPAPLAPIAKPVLHLIHKGCLVGAVSNEKLHMRRFKYTTLHRHTIMPTCPLCHTR